MNIIYSFVEAIDYLLCVVSITIIILLNLIVLLMHARGTSKCKWDTPKDLH